MSKFTYTWKEEWTAEVDADTFEEAQEKFTEMSKRDMKFCGSWDYDITISEGDMVKLIERERSGLV